MNRGPCSRILLFGWCLVSFTASSRICAAETPSVPIATIAFEGNRIFSARQLERILRISVGNGVYAAEDLSDGLRRVETLYADEGFLNATVGPPDLRIQTIGETKAAVVRIRVNEGAQYRAGKLEVKNTRILAPAAFTRMCPLRAGQPYSRGKISQWKERIEETYSSMGHIRARCEARETIHEADKTVDCSLECAEGKSYRVGKITLMADASIDRLQFKKRLMLSEGGTFSYESLILSMRYLNSMRIYEPIASGDVEIAVDDERGVVDLVWHLSLPDGSR